MAEDFERLDELLALVAVAYNIKAEHRARAARQQFLRQAVRRVGFQHGVAHTGDHGVGGQELHHFFGALHVPLHAQRQGLNALQDQPGTVRAHAGAKVAQPLTACAQQKGAHRALFAEHHVVKAVVGLGQFGEFARGFPVKAAAIHHDAAYHRAVAAEELGG